MNKINTKQLYKDMLYYLRGASIRLKLFTTMALAVFLLASNLLIFSIYHYRITKLNEQSKQLEKIMPNIMEALYLTEEFEQSISREDSQKAVAKIDNLKENLYALKNYFIDTPLILQDLKEIDAYVDDFSEAARMFIETKNQEKNYEQSMKETLGILIELIDSAKYSVSSNFPTILSEVNNNSTTITAYEYLTKITGILISNDIDKEEKLLEEIELSTKLSEQLTALNLRDKGLQINIYSKQLYSKWKVVKSAQDFEKKTENELSNIISKINVNSKMAVDNIGKTLEKKEKDRTVFAIVVLICSIIIFVFLAFNITKSITYKLKLLMDATKQIADGDFSVKFIPKDGDEIDLLGKHIYHMAEDLEKYEKNLLETNLNLEIANANLEDAVLERTHELEETRDKLLIVNEELERDKKRLELLATTDSMTGARNRGAIMNLVQREIENYHRFKEPFCVVLFDIDDFKKVNDAYGHCVGDEVVIEISKLVQGCLRESDYIGRYGGEEFLILLTYTQLEEAKVVLESILNRLRSTPLSSMLLPIRISAGLTEYKNETIDELLKKVDVLLYKSKNAGKDQFNF
jgi:diguanylate cyclase (GGDEF)-like protein